MKMKSYPNITTHKISNASKKERESQFDWTTFEERETPSGWSLKQHVFTKASNDDPNRTV